MVSDCYHYLPRPRFCAVEPVCEISLTSIETFGHTNKYLPRYLQVREYYHLLCSLIPTPYSRVDNNAQYYKIRPSMELPVYYLTNTH